MSSRLLSRVRALGLDLSQATDDRERAVAVHDFVRDRIRFGFTPWFDVASPETTLRLGVGHCNPQATLFTSLLGELGIEARLHFVTISNEVLRGLFPDGAGPPSRLSHAFSEVRLSGRWSRVDSYVADPALRLGAAARLAETGWALGFGIHRDADAGWDGRGDAFSQLADDAMAIEDHGPVDGIWRFVGDPAYRHRMGGLPIHTWLYPLRLAPGAVLARMNAGVEKTRARAARAADPGPDLAWAG